MSSTPPTCRPLRFAQSIKNLGMVTEVLFFLSFPDGSSSPLNLMQSFPHMKALPEWLIFFSFNFLLSLPTIKYSVIPMVWRWRDFHSQIKMEKLPQALRVKAGSIDAQSLQFGSYKKTEGQMQHTYPVHQAWPCTTPHWKKWHIITTSQHCREGVIQSLRRRQMSMFLKLHPHFKSCQVAIWLNNIGGKEGSNSTVMGLSNCSKTAVKIQLDRQKYCTTGRTYSF